MPADPLRRDERCAEVYEIQVQGLVNRLEASGIVHVVIGVSGGLDSTQALLVCAQAMDVLGRPRRHILGYTMPGFATSVQYCAWHERYSIGEVRRWLGVFLHRFFKLSQFKRSAIPNAPKVGSGGSLSPRGDWRAPSDSEATAWLDRLSLVPEAE